MSEQEKRKLTKAILELIRTDSQIQSAVINLVCSCPNIVLEY